jgi:hypothetical protein
MAVCSADHVLSEIFRPRPHARCLPRPDAARESEAASLKPRCVCASWLLLSSSSLTLSVTTARKFHPCRLIWLVDFQGTHSLLAIVSSPPPRHSAVSGARSFLVVSISANLDNSSGRLPGLSRQCSDNRYLIAATITSAFDACAINFAPLCQQSSVPSLQTSCASSVQTRQHWLSLSPHAYSQCWTSRPGA